MHWNLGICMRWHDEAKVQYPSLPIGNRLKYAVSIQVGAGSANGSRRATPPKRSGSDIQAGNLLALPGLKRFRSFRESVLAARRGRMRMFA